MKKANLFLLVALILFGFGQYGWSICDGDTDCDGDVDGDDVATLAADLGASNCGTCDAFWQQNGSDIYYNDGNVGIGISSPVWELEVANMTAGDGAESAVTADDAGGGIAAYSSTLPDPFAHYAGRVSLFSDGRSMGLDLRADDSTGDIRFYAGGPWPDNERMRITDTGNVGIGTTSPGASLHISSTIDPNMKVTQTSNTDWARIGLDANGNEFVLSVGAPDSYLPNVFNIWHASSGDILSVTNLGSVGIGTTNPSYTLDVVGQIRADSSGGSGIQGYSVNWYGV